MAEANEKYIRSVTVLSEKDLATVGAWPGEVTVTITAYDNSFKPDEARSLAAMLTQAAEDAEHLTFKDESLESLELVDDRG